MVVLSPEGFGTVSEFHERLLQAAACGVPVAVTDRSPVEALDPELASMVPVVGSAADVAELADRLVDPQVRERWSIPLRRHVITRHGLDARFAVVLGRLGVPVGADERVSVLLCTMRSDFLEHALANVAAQEHVDKELVLVLHGPERFDLVDVREQLDRLEFPTVLVEAPSTMLFGDALNAGLDRATGRYVTKMDDDDYYGPHHITDLLCAHTYSNADIVGKWGNITYLESSDVTIDSRLDREEHFGSHLPGATWLIEADVIRLFGYGRVTWSVDTEVLKRMARFGARFYSTHRFNFIRVRHGDHTFDRDDSWFMEASSGEPRNGLDPAREWA